jgi:hypothetical protein
VATTFPRWLGGVDDLPTGMYTVATDSKRAAMSCPQCGTVFSVPGACGPNHAGRSLYAIRCALETCPFWDFCLFESFWSEEDDAIRIMSDAIRGVR